MNKPTSEYRTRPWQQKLHEVIFEADTPAGKRFDIALIITILVSVLVVMLDSVAAIREEYGELLYILEWSFTLLFTVEYVLRLISIGRPILYARSFFGIVDLLAILPTYISILFPVSRYLLVIRLLRVLRVFRILKFVRFVGEAQMLQNALFASRRKIAVFLFSLLSVVVILGSLIYVVEGDRGGFTSIPTSIYWAVVTLTTVGYGDITPVTGFGRLIAACVMILGYSMLAVPTGIITAEIVRESQRQISTQACLNCSLEGHDTDAEYCKHCGSALHYDQEATS